ncbi:hypothetical protein NPIL_45551 [Nephila pilipes]|uniref:Uncharacterized protein n=1 Tax=Nephila pilipes TaxID=299642 RepID=A0A8X6P238_NEPPI|nr:hypothetical protein NPIL_45551 [Nephila pilipes]
MPRSLSAEKCVQRNSPRTFSGKKRTNSFLVDEHRLSLSCDRKKRPRGLACSRWSGSNPGKWSRMFNCHHSEGKECRACRVS